MWGCISTDFVFTPNFSTGFSCLKSDVIVHIVQWQYWWWFWFTYLWSLYFFFISRTVRARTLKMRPKIYTSFRSHGKWGDFLACIVPVIWCFNILVNSNFILRLMEWQNESTIFTVRIRARQWYWIYKFELKNVLDLLTVPKKVGWNKWLIHTGNSIEVADDYFYALRLRAQNSWSSKYWKNFVKNLKKFKINNNIYFFDDIVNIKKYKNPVINLDTYKSLDENILNFDLNKTNDSVVLNEDDFLFDKFLFKNDDSWLCDSVLFNHFNKKNVNGKKISSLFNSLSKTMFLTRKAFKSFLYDIDLLASLSYTEKKKKLVNLSTKRTDYGDFSRFTKKRVFEKKPILITKSFLPLNLESFNNELLNVSFDATVTVEKKMNTDLFYLTLKQKRYKRKKNIPLRIRLDRSTLNQSTAIVKYTDKPYLVANKIIKNLEFNATSLYRCLKKNKARSENFSVQLSRRLLRTKKTLVLPSHVNITLISNSYDVIHSWFIPALGIKIDCVPGRATHHTFYCDSVGFYYGQCAEICGRYHHHMPIKLCILPFEHFLIWWQHFGLPKLLFTESKNRFETSYSLKKFCW